MEQGSPHGVEDVAVVSCDILGHSSANGGEQVRRVAAINDIVSVAIRRNRPDQVVWSSGGDGGHVVFRDPQWQRNAIRLVWDLLSWSRAEHVKLRITGHVGQVTSIWGADGRVQVVGSGINFAGWLLRQLNREAVVVSEAFRDAVAGVDLDRNVRFHDDRLFLDRNSVPRLLFLMSLDDVPTKWLEGERDDYTELKRSLGDETGDKEPAAAVRKDPNGWHVLYHSKRIWQVNSKDKRVAAALKRIVGTLRSAEDQKSLLASMGYGELADFVRIGQLVERRPGEVICRYGDPGESMFVILRGEVGIYNFEGGGFGGEATPKHLHRQGEVVGELASVLNRNRTADLVALTDVALLAFTYEEVKKTLPTAATKEFDRFMVERVLEHVTQAASYLVGPDRKGPLSAVAEGSQVRLGVEDAWRDALLVLGEHCELITIEAGGRLDLEFDHVAPDAEDRDGLYVLVSGSVRSPDAIDADLHGAQCPALFVDLPNLLVRPPASYRRAKEPIKVLKIGAAGIDQLELSQRLRLRSALGGYDYHVYLCHASQDKDVVRQLRDRLEHHGIRCWFDEDELPVGHSARARMEQGLLSSRYLLVCASEHLRHGLWANQEIDAVLQTDVEHRDEPKVLVLKLNEDSVESSVPLLLRGKKWLEYQRPGDFDRLIEFLKP